MKNLIVNKCNTAIWAIQWKIGNKVQDIKGLIEGRTVLTSHCFQETEDPMASLSHNLDNLYICRDFNLLPRQVKGLLKRDRWQLPSFRVKRRKSS
ncbi:unnamed protein product [Withania somnifera]